MLKDIIEMMIPLYGDIKIHRLFSKDRRESRVQIRKIKSSEKQLVKREEQFNQELSDLLRKYNISEQMGSLVSYPSRFEAREKSDLGNLCLRSTYVPEIVMYVGKYAVLISAYYQFLHWK
ncbi:MAG: hypothetical protein KAI26_08955 [Nanoarchaeota archaeon]|nr:hypothetical protein [Nanoarchaeota archaeon]